jgi:peptide/nickel transport system substrate-binding protein
MSVLSLLRMLWISLIGALLLLGLLTGCDFIAATAPAPTSDRPTAAPLLPTAVVEPSPTPQPVGGNLTMRLAVDVPDLRPWQPRSRSEEQLISLLYRGLIRLDDAMRPQPDLAQLWEATPDGRTLTFTLRSDLRWHDGTPLDAQDVIFTLERLRELPPTETALLADLRYITAITAPTPTSIVLTLSSRHAPLLAALAVPVLPRHLLTDRDINTLNFWDTPIGSGPFRLAERQPGQAIVLERYADFHHGAPLLERVALVVAPDPAIALNALRDEELLLAELPWSLQDSISAVAPQTRSAAYPENGYYFLGFNLREGRPFADLRVRRALAGALDLPRLVETATKAQGVPIASSAMPGSWADLTPAPDSATDLAAARALLDEAGWILPDGATIRQREGAQLTAQLYVRGDDERRVVAARRIAEVAASIGIQIEVIPADFASVILARYAPPYDFDLLLGSWANGMGDPNFTDAIFYDPDDFALFHSSQLVQGDADGRTTRNFVGFSDPAYDNQAEAARQLYRLEERIAAISQAQARIAAELPYLFLWVDRFPVALNNRITTLDGPVNLASPLYLWNIERWYLE